MASSSEIATLITQGIRPPSGNQDVSYHTGEVKSWDPVSGVNVVEVNGVQLPNLSALQNGMGTNFIPGDIVEVIRVQTKYFILGRVSAPNGFTGSAPQSITASGDTISGTTGTWRDLNGGTGVSPVITARIGSSALISFGVATLAASNALVDVSIAFTGPSSNTPGEFTQWFFTAGINSNANFGPTTNQAPSKQLMVVKNTGVRGLGNGQFERFVPGVYTFSLKYRLALFNNGTGVSVGTPWLTVIPF